MRASANTARRAGVTRRLGRRRDGRRARPIAPRRRPAVARWKTGVPARCPRLRRRRSGRPGPAGRLRSASRPTSRPRRSSSDNSIRRRPRTLTDVSVPRSIRRRSALTVRPVARAASSRLSSFVSGRDIGFNALLPLLAVTDGPHSHRQLDTLRARSRPGDTTPAMPTVTAGNRVLAATPNRGGTVVPTSNRSARQHSPWVVPYKPLRVAVPARTPEAKRSNCGRRDALWRRGVPPGRAHAVSPPRGPATNGDAEPREAEDPDPIRAVTGLYAGYPGRYPGCRRVSPLCVTRSEVAASPRTRVSDLTSRDCGLRCPCDAAGTDAHDPRLRPRDGDLALRRCNGGSSGGTLNAVMIDGKRRIALDELRRRRLLVTVAPEHPRTRVVDEPTAALIRRVASLERELHTLRVQVIRMQGTVKTPPRPVDLQSAGQPTRTAVAPTSIRARRATSSTSCAATRRLIAATRSASTDMPLGPPPAAARPASAAA